MMREEVSIQPKLDLKREPIDWVIEMIGAVGLVLLVGLPILNYGELPEKIPSHFGLGGTPDAFSSKRTIWILPMIGAILCLGMTVLNRFPHIFNYPKNVTEENAPALYRIATKMIRILCAMLTCSLCYITFVTIEIAGGTESGLGPYFLVVFLTGILAPAAYYFFRLCKA